MSRVIKQKTNRKFSELPHNSTQKSKSALMSLSSTIVQTMITLYYATNIAKDVIRIFVKDYIKQDLVLVHK